MASKLMEGEKMDLERVGKNSPLVQVQGGQKEEAPVIAIYRRRGKKIGDGGKERKAALDVPNPTGGWVVLLSCT